MGTLILLILGMLPGVWGGEWRVTFDSHCALRGASVLIDCEYDYPFAHLVTSVTWSKCLYVSGRLTCFPLKKLPSPRGHFDYVGSYSGDCRLKVSDVRPEDEGRYFFSFTTTLSRWMSRKPMYLSVGELTTIVQPRTVTEGDRVSLTCRSSCPESTDVVWFRDGQPVGSPVFQARREDAGRYYCAVLGQEAVRSAPVALKVQYAPREVRLSVSPPGHITSGDSVTLTCSSDAAPPVAHSAYRLYKDGQLIGSGQKYMISDILPGHRGRYHCQAWNNVSRGGIDLINSTEVHLDVQYPPMNILVSVDPQHFAEGSRVNLTCSSLANPAADDYTWYKMGDSDSSMLQVGSGQRLSFPSMEESQTGLYLCQVRNSVGESNSTSVRLSMQEKQQGQPVLVLAAVGVSLSAMLLVALLLFWKKLKPSATKKDLIRGGSRSSCTEEPPDTTYANIHTSPSSVPPRAIDAASQRRLCHDDAASYEDEVTYSTVTIRPKDKSLPHQLNSSRRPHDSWHKARGNEDSVIYATVGKSS